MFGPSKKMRKMRRGRGREVDGGDEKRVEERICFVHCNTE